MFVRSAIACLMLVACQDANDKGSGPDASVDSSGDAADLTSPPDGVDATEAPEDAAPDATGDPDANEIGDAIGDATGDATGAPAGTACVSEDECSSGWCVPSAIGQVCVDICIDSCEAGEACIPAADSGTDPVFLCVPFVGPPGPDTVGGDSDDSTISSDGDDTGPVDDAITDAGPDAVDTGEPDGTVSDGDLDDDGIPDEDDNLPCLAVWLIVYNVDVSSASLVLNGTEVVSSNQFPTDETITVFINPSTGENTIELGGKLTGSPTDRLVLVVIDSNDTIWFSTVIEREHGKPEDQSFTFTIDATCP